MDVNYKSFLQGNYINSLFFKDTTPGEIESITMKLKNKSSSGSDELSTALIKNFITLISKHLSEIINLSLTKGIVPDKMKIAKIIPLFKSGDNNIYKTFRPVSILPSFSKILEKVVYNRLIDYLTKFNILNKNQYGFRQKHSTAMAILDFVEKIHSAIDMQWRILYRYLFRSRKSLWYS